MEPRTHDLEIEFVSPASYGAKRKAPGRACVKCHERKVKCDLSEVPQGWPCANCNKSGDTCRVVVDRRFGSRVNVPLETGRSFTSGHSTIHGEEPTISTLQTEAPTSQRMHSDYDVEQYSYPHTEQNTPDDQVLRLEPVHNSNASSQFPTRKPTTERFENFVKDVLGELAPSFAPDDSPEYNSMSGRISYHATVDLADRPTLDIERQFLTLDAADMQFLRAKGAFNLPPFPLQEEIITAYFAHVNPSLPILEEGTFMNSFRNNTVSRLLLFAIFTAGCKVCQNPLLLDRAGTKFQAGLRFYKATKALLDTNAEGDRLSQIQSYLLITWWWDKKDDGGQNMRGCTVNAINIAQSIGMTRWGQYPAQITTRRLWKRVWWACVVRDVTVATTSNQPLLLQAADYDVEPLTPEDFRADGGLSHESSFSAENIQCFIHQTRLAEMLALAHTRSWRAGRINQTKAGTIAERQAAVGTEASGMTSTLTTLPASEDLLASAFMWYSSLPPELHYDVDDLQTHRFWPAFLHIFFFMILCTYHRDKAVTKARNARELIEKHWHEARGISAATMMFKIVRNMKAHGQVLQCPGFLSHCLFNCLIFCFIEAKCPDPGSRHSARQKYSLCLNSLYDFSQRWVSASLIYQLFSALQPELDRHTSQPDSNSRYSASPEGGYLYEPVLGGLMKSPGEVSNQTMLMLLQSSISSAYSFGGEAQPTSSAFATSFVGDGQFSLDLGAMPPEFFGYNLEIPNQMDVDQWYNFYGLQPS